MTRFLRQTAKSALQRAGVYERVRGAIQRLDPSRAKYRGIKRYTCELNGVPVHFSTESDYMNRWFFPRYENGALHETRVTELIVDALQDARSFVDAGANIGWYTCMAAGHMPGGSVYAFEMDRVNYDLLSRNVEVNEFANVEAYHAAVTESPGNVSFARPTRLPSATLTLAPQENAAKDMVSVEAVSLDAFFSGREHPDVVKIDVEGAEMGVLQGMASILETSRPTLFLEVHPRKIGSFGTSVAEILRVLFDLGYSVSAIQDMRDLTAEHPLVPITSADQLEGTTMLYVRMEPAA